MNFKFTKTKSIVSIIIGIIIGYGMTFFGNNEVGIEASRPLATVWFFYIAPIVLAYVIWSLFQKK